jgi:hypothetical protein
MKNGLIEARFLLAPSRLARVAAPLVEFGPVAASPVRWLRSQFGRLSQANESHDLVGQSRRSCGRLDLNDVNDASFT